MDVLKAMTVFVTVVEAGSQSGAARRLDLSRAVVSRAVAELEEWAGARLLHRTTRRTGLTAAGEETLARCRQVLDITEDMRRTTPAPAARPRGSLRVTATSAFGQAQLTRILTDFLRQEPGVSIDLLLLDRTVNLVEERVDVAIRIADQVDPNLIARKLTVCRSVLSAAPGYLASHPAIRHVRDLSAHHCLTHAHYGRSTWAFEVGGKPVSVAVSGPLTADDAIAIAQAAQNGAGVALLPTFVAVPFFAAGSLVAILPDAQPAKQDIYAVYSSRKHMSPALRALLDFLAKELPAEPAWDLALKQATKPGRSTAARPGAKGSSSGRRKAAA